MEIAHITPRWPMQSPSSFRAEQSLTKRSYKTDPGKLGGCGTVSLLVCVAEEHSAMSAWLEMQTGY